MSELTSDPYQETTTKSDRHLKEKGILQFERLSAWAVFLLSMLTFGFYPIYWLYTRTQIVNSNHKDKISMTVLAFLFPSALISFGLGFTRGSDTILMMSSIADITFYVIFLVALFQIRFRLEDIMAAGRATCLSVSIPLTFLFSVIYLQYKINERIDECRNEILNTDQNDTSSEINNSVARHN
ncbi:MAG: DUF4234 domain-containing protein [Thiohalomonadales bacterium]